MIDLNTLQKKPKLPFIYLPQLNMKILIDSGASNSVINCQPAYEKFSDYLYKDSFAVTGLGSTIHADDNLFLPLLHELGIHDCIHLHVINWHDRFDALLGSEDLQNLNAKIDYETNTLEIADRSIPFSLEYTTRELEPECVYAQHSIKIPVSIHSGDVLFPETAINENVLIPESIVTAENGYCLFPLETDIEINFHERIPVIPLNETDIIPPPKFHNKTDISQVIRTEHLNQEEKNEILTLCRKYKEIFYNEKSDLTFTNAVKHQIRTTDEAPVYVKSYRHPHAMKAEIQSQIQKLLDNKIIQPSISPYSAPVWIVPKKLDASGKRKFRMVIDYRKLNEKTVEDKYPLPRIDEILDNLGKCSYFSTLDLAQGFHQIEMHHDSIEKTAFSVNNGHYEYVRMPFGLKNSPSTFQRVMDNVLREYLHKFCFVYMDDIVCFSKSLNEHIQHLRKIFQKLKEFNLKVQLDKSEFLRKEVEFLGHVITQEGVKPNPSKIEAVEKFPLPTTPKEIKSFLGLIGYYRRFIANFSQIVTPLTKCLKKGAKIDVRDVDYLTAFHTCKELLTNAPILAYPDFTKPFKLTTDASNVAIGSVLSQCNRPVAYYSRTLNSAEKNYSTIEKELLAILDATKHFRPYLFGRKFTIETDHNPLVWLYKIKEPNSKLIRWKLKLEEFDFTITYKRGKENYVADALSRVEIHHNETDDTESVQPNIDEIPDPMDLDEVLDTFNQMQPPNENEAIHISNATNDDNESCIETIHSTQEDNGKCIPVTERPVNIYHNRIILKLGDSYKRRIKRPFNRNTHLATINKDTIEENLTDLIRDIFQPDLTYGVFFYDQELRGPFLNLVKTIFNYSVKIFISNTYCQDVIHSEIQKEIVAGYHEETHNGIIETINKIKDKFFWPNMKTTVTQIINTCETCLQAKYERHPYNLKFSGPLLAKRPFEIIHMDTFSFQNSKFLTIIDLFSRYAQSYLVKDGTSLTILSKLRHYFAHHNIPQKIVCDEGREFKNKTFAEFCKLFKIELHYTTVNNPSSNSPIERFHSTILEKLRVLNIKNPKELPSNLMISATLIYNQSIHSATGFSPFHLLYGPYDRLIEMDMDMTIFEQYNEKRKQEILPFYDQVYNKNKQKAEKTLEKRNESRNDPPDLTDKIVYVERNRPRKTDPPFEKITVTEQDQNKIQGLTKKNRPTTANIKTVKRLRQLPLLQVTDDSPSTSGSTDPEPGVL